MEAGDKVKIRCATADCKYNGDDNFCQLKSVSFGDCYIHTKYQGRQHLWKCNGYEESEMAREIREWFERNVPRE